MSTHEKTEDVRAYLPWYVNNTLDESTKQEVETAIAASPALKAEVEWLHSLQSKLKHDKMLTDVSTKIGIDRFNALVKNDQQGKVISMPSRWQQWQRPLMAVAATVIVVQMGVIGTLINNQPETITTLSGETATANQENMALLQITFNDKATSTDIQRVLNSMEAEIVGGPSALSVYTIQLSDSHLLDNISTLRKDAAIESVSQRIE